MAPSGTGRTGGRGAKKANSSRGRPTRSCSNFGEHRPAVPPLAATHADARRPLERGERGGARGEGRVDARQPRPPRSGRPPCRRGRGETWRRGAANRRHRPAWKPPLARERRPRPRDRRRADPRRQHRRWRPRPRPPGRRPDRSSHRPPGRRARWCGRSVPLGDEVAALGIVAVPAAKQPEQLVGGQEAIAHGDDVGGEVEPSSSLAANPSPSTATSAEPNVPPPMPRRARGDSGPLASAARSRRHRGEDRQRPRRAAGGLGNGDDLRTRAPQLAGDLQVERAVAGDQDRRPGRTP